MLIHGDRNSLSWVSLSILFEPLALVIFLIVVVAVLYYYRSSLFIGMHVRKYGAPSDRGRNQLKTETKRECPNCGGTMEFGYLVGPQGIYWSKDAPLSGLFPGRGMGVPGGEPLGFSSLLRGPIRVQNFKAYRCQRCSIVQVELNDQQPAEF